MSNSHFCYSHCVQMIITLVCTIGPTLFVFFGGLNHWYSMDIRLAIAIMLGCFNVATFIVFCIDKCCSKGDGCRISEVVLFYLSFYGSPFGALAGMCCANHKTSKGGFLFIVLVFFVFNLLWMFVYFIVSAKTSLAKAFE